MSKEMIEWLTDCADDLRALSPKSASADMLIEAADLIEAQQKRIDELEKELAYANECLWSAEDDLITALRRIEDSEKYTKDVLQAVYDPENQPNQFGVIAVEQLAASQAREKVLREALETLMSCVDCSESRNSERNKALATTLAKCDDALSTPQDDSALQAAIAAEREACAVVCEEIRVIVDGNRSWTALHVQDQCIKAIRAKGDSK